MKQRIVRQIGACLLMLALLLSVQMVNRHYRSAVDALGVALDEQAVRLAEARRQQRDNEMWKKVTAQSRASGVLHEDYVRKNVSVRADGLDRHAANQKLNQYIFSDDGFSDLSEFKIESANINEGIFSRMKDDRAARVSIVMSGHYYARATAAAVRP
jgi:hypothetical protein